MIYHVEVGVCRHRPIRTQQYRYYVIEAESGNEAELIAQQIACCTSVSPTESLVVSWEE